MEYRIDQLHIRLKEIQKEIKEYQENCRHKEQEIKFTTEREIRWVCKRCELPRGWPSKEEEGNWLETKRR